MRHVAIRSTGHYVPDIEVSNDDLRKRFDAKAPEFVDKMEASTGIRTRWRAPDGWATSDLAVRAGREALERAGIGPADVGLVVVGTDSPDYVTPATSVVVQEKLGAKGAGTFDVGCACASFPTGVAAAAGILAGTPSLGRALVIGAYRMSALADPDDPMTFFYGDGAGAAVLEPSDAPGILGSAFRADGSFAKRWAILSGGTAEPATEASVREGRTVVRMYDRYPPEVNDEGWPAVVHRLADDNAFEIGDIDLAVFTQVRSTTIAKVMETLGLPLEKAPMVMDKWGYTGSACVPMAFHDAVLKGQVQPGQLVTLVGSGVGYNQAGVALRITDALVR